MFPFTTPGAMVCELRWGGGRGGLEFLMLIRDFLSGECCGTGGGVGVATEVIRVPDERFGSGGGIAALLTGGGVTPPTGGGGGGGAAAPPNGGGTATPTIGGG